ncbi:symmetrical bis(5'-nucleosyl)-tetraphosphatase [Vibrio sp. JC009]|uniref:symmetrical bis(5'-nucleosyl)-tetraphosphatase n=1 Tax=Vibrio sp. JC009 TaxID=2912314 RepID=UPI0023B04B63|nr:symmetrical bis(5'-nucleosyl)-tetraphosphatase [Vibrio sp. JC009]WED22148.1 symmetrical bis(5'-nucleosyl)-tetraphosphatase [Vibrio sp. JC009]
MANYIVGDIQGCFDELEALLNKAKFDKAKDVLWLAGDLVARGPKSLETLRFVKSLGDSAVVVLGNHDLHLLAVSLGVHPEKKKDKTMPIFAAPDREELLDWLRKQPLLAEHPEFVVCHAGVSPQWDLATARSASEEISHILRGDNWRELIEEMYANTPDIWDENLSGIERYRYIINAYTRMRFCHLDTRLDMLCKLPPHEMEEGELIPWFKVPGRKPLGKTVLFGHWAALKGGEYNDVIGLDTGCVWGGTLTMLRWEDREYFVQEAL